MKLPAVPISLILLAALDAAGFPALSQPQPASVAPTPTAAPAPVTAVIAPISGANLNISPKRITFDRNHRSGTVYIFNQGTGPGTFDISLIDRVMLPDGQIMPLSEAQARPDTKAFADRLKSAQAILQVAPRRVTLNPGQGQTVRLRIIGAPADAGAGGELRTHLTIATLPPRDAGVTAEAAAANVTPNQLRFQINALLGLSIPAIVRMGDIDVRAAIENARVSQELLNGPTGPRTPTLSLDLVRQGQTSLFGNFEVRVAGDPHAPPLGLSRGVGVYTEIDRRAIRIPLTRALAPGEHLEVTFTDDDTSPGKVLAKLTL
jgi:P pilus assembly chaperone PapD